MCSTEFCQWVIHKAEEYSVPVLIDPKGRYWEKYNNCTFITPNIKELSEVANEKIANEDRQIVCVADRIRKQYGIKYLVVTRSEKGITVVCKDQVIHVPATAKEVFDVSGAGDTVAATLLACIAGKLPLKQSVFLANRAAGIVVGKVGTYPVRREELIEDLKNS